MKNIKCVQIQKDNEEQFNGEPFWCSLGFADSGKTDPDNHKPIYIKKVEK